MTLTSEEAARVLGVAPDAPAEAVRRAYKALALRTHPDKNKAPDAAAQFQRVSAAYKRLTEGPEEEEEAFASEADMFAMFDALFGGFMAADAGLFDEFSEQSDAEEMLLAMMGGSDLGDMGSLFAAMDEPLSFETKRSQRVRREAGARPRSRRPRACEATPPGVRRRGEGGMDFTPDMVDMVEDMEAAVLSMMLSGGGFFGVDDEAAFVAEESHAERKAAPRRRRETSLRYAEPAAAPWPAEAKEAATQGGGAKRRKPVAVGALVLVRGRHAGVVRFRGEVHYARGQWLGVELEEAEGKNDGMVKGVEYFFCPPHHGIMVREEEVVLL